MASCKPLPINDGKSRQQSRHPKQTMQRRTPTNPLLSAPEDIHQYTLKDDQNGRAWWHRKCNAGRKCHSRSGHQSIFTTCLASHHPLDNLCVITTRRPGVRQRGYSSSPESKRMVGRICQNKIARAYTTIDPTRMSHTYQPHCVDPNFENAKLRIQSITNDDNQSQ